MLDSKFTSDDYVNLLQILNAAKITGNDAETIANLKAKCIAQAHELDIEYSGEHKVQALRDNLKQGSDA